MNNTLKNALKPCPFCGGQAQIRYFKRGCSPSGYTSNVYMRSERGLVCCIKCGASTMGCSRVCRAVDKWNRRAGEEGKHE